MTKELWGEGLVIIWDNIAKKMLITFKLEGTENYKVWSAVVQLALLTRYKSGFITGKCVRNVNHGPLQEQWDRCNDVVLSWQFDSLVDLPTCTCEDVPKLKEHAQLLRLMQFLMGLEEIFIVKESISLTTKPIPECNASKTHASVAGASQHITICATFLYDIIDVTHLNLTVAHSNRTVEQVKQRVKT
ncbi:ribonuclease H-like domain-containing protein [Tanacetum coccineum]